MIRVLTALVLLLHLNISTEAQKETSFWLDRFYSFDFNTYPPENSNLTASSIYQNGRATVADSAGNLLFYSDGLTYYERTGKVMPNGKPLFALNWGTSFLPFIIAPVPGNKNRYYVFTIRLPRSSQHPDFDHTLRYSIVDMQLNDGNGDVVQRDIEIAPNIRDEFTLIKTPADITGFWLVCVGIQDFETLLAYRITKDGISGEPVKTNTGAFIDQSLMKASPDGRFLALRSTPIDGSNLQGTHRLKIFELNGETGSFALFRQMVTPGPKDENAHPQTHVWMANPEFSSDSRFLYVLKDSTFSPEINQFKSFRSIHCFDMQAGTQEAFLNSRQIVHTYPENQFPVSTRMQLTPQRKIVIGDLTASGFFSTIHNPKECGVAAKGFELKSIALPDDFFGAPPVFPAWYFYEPPAIQQDFAGNDSAVCPRFQVTLGTAPLPGHQYSWTYQPGLVNTASAQAIFHAPENISGENDTTTLRLVVNDASGCNHYDSVKIVTKPVSQWKILGSRSVCPGVEEVKYWIENNWTGEKIEWQVEGGFISEGHQTDTVLVNWGASNAAAYLQAFSENENGCADEIAPFPVKVFKILDTETPLGRDTLLCDDLTEGYKILPTNGSSYDWAIINGTLLEGQGTHQVKVAWDADALNGHLWINESVNTDLEICFGRSDTLQVVNPGQMLSQNLHLYNISGTVTSSDTLEIIYGLDQFVFYHPEIMLQRREGDNPWETVGLARSNLHHSAFGRQPLDDGTFSFRLLALNTCGDSAISDVHKNVFLETEGDEVANEIDLFWNAYTGWGQGLAKYEIFRALDDDSKFILKGKTEDKFYASGNNTDGFIHTYYVEAISPGSGYRSISNKVTLEFENALLLPNIITPNGDSKNDFWNPYPLELYPENQLIIYNRWGVEIYSTANYSGTWDGNGLAAGIYFYSFQVKKNDTAYRNYRGFIQIMR